jgi:CBS domain-containing protein
VDISSNKPVTLEQSKTHYDTRNIMFKYNLNRVAILKDKKNKEPLGIITEEENVYQYIRQRPETSIRCR